MLSYLILNPILRKKVLYELKISIKNFVDFIF